MTKLRLTQIATAIALFATVVGCGDDGTSMPDATPDGAPDGATDAEPDAEPPRMCDNAVSAMMLGAGGEAGPTPDGIGGEGDLAVENGVVRLVFSAIDRPSGVAASGGNLVDFHLIGQSDHMNELSQLAGPDQALQVAYTDLSFTEASDRIVVTASGHVQPQPQDPGEDPAITPDPGTNLTYVTEYTVFCDEPMVHVTSTLTNASPGDGTTYATSPSFGILDVMLWGQRSLIPFCPAQGQGSECNPFDIDNPVAGLVDSRYVGSTGSVVGDPGTFAFYVDDPIEEGFIGVHSPQVSSFGAFSIVGGSFRPGSQKQLTRVFIVGGGADAASATDLALDGLAAQGLVEVGTVRGTVTPPAGGALSADPYRRPLVVLATPGTDPVNPERWTPATMVRVAADGTFEARVPAGDISWELRVDGMPPQRSAGGDVPAGGELDLGELSMDPPAELRVTIRDNTTGTPTDLPARVIVKGVDGADDPNFGPFWGASPAANIAYTDAVGDVTLNLPAGDYEVWATHGPYYTIARQRVTVPAEGLDVAFELIALDVLPADMITADFHVHSAASFDSSLPIDDRVRAFVAEGVQAIVATEHDVIFDYAPAWGAIQDEFSPRWRSQLATFVGLESTGTVPQPDFIHTTGHHNAFPLTVQPGQHKSGAPGDENLDVGTLYDMLRGLPSPANPLIQLNHGRAGRTGSVWLGYLDACGFDPAAAFDETSDCFASAGPMGARPYDFDAMEVINGKNGRRFVDMSRDWFAMLRNAPNGRLPIATANSDSHELVLDQAGYPLTLLHVPGTAVDGLDDAGLVAAVDSGAVAGSLGVVVWIGAHEAGTDGPLTFPGRTPLQSGSLEVQVRVTAAPWVPVEEVRLRLGGVVVARLTVAAGDLTAPADPFGTDGVVRFDGFVDLSGTTITEDTFLTAEAGFALGAVADLDGDGIVDATDNDDDGDIDMDDVAAGGVDVGAVPPEMGVIAPGSRPIGYTNPIYIDVDGTAGYDAPGTPLVD